MVPGGTEGKRGARGRKIRQKEGGDKSGTFEESRVCRFYLRLVQHANKGSVNVCCTEFLGV